MSWVQLLSGCLRSLFFLVAITFSIEKASRFLLVMKGCSSGSCCGQCLFCIVEIIHMGTSDIFPTILEPQGLVRG